MKDAPEAWEWERIQSEACPQCGLDPARLPVGTLGANTVEAAARWREFLESADPGTLRRSAGPEVWTPLQYAFHVRDMLRKPPMTIDAVLGAADRPPQKEAQRRTGTRDPERNR